MAWNGPGRSVEVDGRTAGSRASVERSRALLERILELHGAGLDEEAIASRILGPEPEVILFRTQTLVSIVIDLVGQTLRGGGADPSRSKGGPCGAREGSSLSGAVHVRWSDADEPTSNGRRGH